MRDFRIGWQNHQVFFWKKFFFIRPNQRSNWNLPANPGKTIKEQFLSTTIFPEEIVFENKNPNRRKRRGIFNVCWKQQVLNEEVAPMGGVSTQQTNEHFALVEKEVIEKRINQKDFIEKLITEYKKERER